MMLSKNTIIFILLVVLFYFIYTNYLVKIYNNKETKSDEITEEEQLEEYKNYVTEDHLFSEALRGV